MALAVAVPAAREETLLKTRAVLDRPEQVAPACLPALLALAQSTPEEAQEVAAVPESVLGTAAAAEVGERRRRALPAQQAMPASSSSATGVAKSLPVEP